MRVRLITILVLAVLVGACGGEATVTTAATTSSTTTTPVTTTTSRPPTTTAPVTTTTGVPATTTSTTAVSEAGLVWSRVPAEGSVFGGAGDQEMSDVVVGGPGLVALGSGVWVSSDGLTWQRVWKHFGGTINSVVVGGPGLVAVGSVGVWDERVAVWVSPPPG